MINEAQFDIINPTTTGALQVNATPIYWRSNLREAVIAHVKEWSGGPPNDVQMDGTTGGAIRLDGEVVRFRITH